ncbi:MAG: alpha/beta fold hydrolase [Pseudomonadota bacterium]|nr:alpha/beta fold hydrolase [Pseudomonadota bacterium]
MHWYHKGDQNKPAILFFHGNTGQISDFIPGLVPIVRAGYSVLAMEYRNFGKTEGSISQKAIFQDAANAFDFLKKQGHKKIVAYGYSFGTAFATGLTSLRPVDGVILTAPFSSLNKIVSEKPVPFARYLLKDTYPSDIYLQNYTKPLLIIHGKNDNLIPPHHGQLLFEQAQSIDKHIHLLDNTDHITIFWRFKNLPFIMNFLKKLSEEQY